MSNNCQRCTSKQILKISGKLNGEIDISTPQVGICNISNFLNIQNVSNGIDDVNLDICFSCGQIQGNWPVDLTKVDVQITEILEFTKG